MKWGWLEAIITALLKHGQRQAEKPKTTESANTPPEIARKLGESYQVWLHRVRARNDEWLRNKNSDHSGHDKGLGSDQSPDPS